MNRKKNSKETRESSSIFQNLENRIGKSMHKEKSFQSHNNRILKNIKDLELILQYEWFV